MKPEIVEIKYDIALTKNQWQILDVPAKAYDFIQEMEKRTCAEKIDWSGHYGRAILFSLRTNDMTDTKPKIPVSLGLAEVIEFLEEKLGES